MSISGLSGSLFAGTRGVHKAPSFETLDSNGDKSITLDDLKAKAPGGATAAGDKRAEALFKALNANGDGGVTADEKSAFDTKVQDKQANLAFLTQQISAPSNADVFAATDTDADGAVSLAEFSNDDAAKGASADMLKQIFNLIDSNGDGSISSGESSQFLDEVKSAVAGTSSSTGDQTAAPPPPSASSTSSSATDLLVQAQGAYSSASKATDLISMLQSLLATSA